MNVYTPSVRNNIAIIVRVRLLGRACLGVGTGRFFRGGGVVFGMQRESGPFVMWIRPWSVQRGRRAILPSLAALNC